MYVEVKPGFGFSIEKNDENSVTIFSTTYRVDNSDTFIEFFTEWATSVPEQLDRSQYEAACAKYGFTPKSDSELTSTEGHFDYQTYFSTAEKRQFGIPAELNKRRAVAISHEKKHAVPAIASIGSEPNVITKEGQLWDECKCGREPVYMPLHLCDNCWPK